MPTPKLHATISAAEQVINPFSISHLTEVGWLDNTEYLFFIWEMHATKSFFFLIWETHTHIGHATVSFLFIWETHTYKGRGWDKRIHLHANIKTACNNYYYGTNNKPLLNITLYWCGITGQQIVSFYWPLKLFKLLVLFWKKKKSWTLCSMDVPSSISIFRKNVSPSDPFLQTPFLHALT